MSRVTPVHDTRRRGFVLLTILGVIISLALLTTGIALVDQAALASARNRMALTAGQWRAEGCVERARATIDAAMTGAASDDIAAVWDSLDRVVATSPLLQSVPCTVVTRAAGAGLDINSADAGELRQLFVNLQISSPRADSLTDALLDWRDPDTVPRAFGAERAWYRAAHRPEPRDTAFEDVRELLLVRGFEHFGDTLALLTTDPGLMPLSQIPLVVLATLPGITPEIALHTATLRQRGQRIPEISALAATLPQDDQQELMQHYGELSHLVTPTPERWIVTATVTEGDPPVQAVTSIWLAHAGVHVVVVGRR